MISKLLVTALLMNTWIKDQQVCCLENVALNKSTSQSSTLGPRYTSDKAVDGNWTTCSKTMASEMADWWTVDLGKPHDVYEVELDVGWEQHFLFYRGRIEIANEENFQQNSTIICREFRFLNGKRRYTCYNPPVRGRYVMISNHDIGNEGVHACEVQVLSCPAGFWGYNLANTSDCSEACDRCNYNEPCGVENGYCYGGCIDGLWGMSCDQTCDCGEDQRCDQYNGTCPPGEVIEDAFNGPQSSENYGLIVGMTVLAAVAIVTVATGVALYKRSLRQKNQQPANQELSMAVTDITEVPSGQATTLEENQYIYDEIHEYEDVKEENGVKKRARYENAEIEDKVYVSLRPAVLETIRAHMRNQNIQESESPTPVSLPEQVYEDLYSGKERRPVPLDGVKSYINLIGTEIQKYRSDYQDEIQVLYSGLLEELRVKDTVIPCSRFLSVYKKLQEINPTTFKSTLQEQYQALDLMKPSEEKTKSVGMTPENIHKNRSMNIIPDDRYRPILKSVMDGRTDFINAVIITGVNKKVNFIITQSPVKDTIADLWRMMNDYNCKVIVMLESKWDLPEYWPPEVGASIQFDPFTVRNNVYGLDTVNINIHIRDIQITVENSCYESQEQKIKQFSLKEWDQSTLVQDFIRLVDLVRKWQEQAPSPVVIHCKNGADRSGLFCAALYIVEQIKTQQEVDIFSAVKHIRLYRPQCIVNLEQYIFLHEFALNYIKRRESVC